MKTSRKSRIFRQLLATTLLLGGPFQLAAPVFAQATPPNTLPNQDTTAGTQIRNTATGTYEDPNQPGQQINTTSNTVTITVAEVAGITVTGSGVTDTNEGTIRRGDVLNYDFTVTNVGNDATRIFIPNTATVTGGTRGQMQYSTDGGNTFTNVPADGATTGSIPAGGTVLVRVPVTASADATPGSRISVTLGNTDPANGQNVAYTADAINDDVRTVDNTGTDGGDASAAAPANGEREASATQQSGELGAALEILNGPRGQAAAVGTTNQDDFTNASTPVQAGVAPGQPIDPGTTTITNTLRDNTATDPEVVSLLPTAPANQAALPDGTLVTINYGTQTAVYRYAQATGFTFEPAGSTETGATDPVEVNLPAGGTADYTVTIDLPGETPQFTGFSVPITAFIDIDNNGAIAATGESPNTTIDRVYTGFLRLTKESRILQGTGPAVPAGQDQFNTEPKTPAPGNIIEYRITYRNISEPAQGGSGNVLLNASSVQITEDGTTGGNTWALDSDNNGQMDTSNVTGTAADSSGGTIVSTPAGDGANVTRYVDTVPGQVAPGASGTFTLQRRVN